MLLSYTYIASSLKYCLLFKGDTYQSHIDLGPEGNADIEDIQLETSVENLLTRPLVFFDLETGGLGLIIFQ